MRTLVRLVVLTVCLGCVAVGTAMADTEQAFHEVVAAAKAGQMDKTIGLLNGIIANGAEGNAKRLSMAYNMRGVCYEDKGDKTQAMADYSKAIELDSKNADAYGNRSILYMKLGDTEKAKADAVAAKRIDRNVRVPSFD